MSVDNLTPQIPTNLGSWALLVAQAIESYGLDSDKIYKEVGVDLVDLKKNAARFPAYLMVKVWNIAVQRTQDPYIAIRVAKFFKPGAYSALGMTMVASRHVYDALKRASRYARFIGDAHTSSLEESANDVALVLRSRPELRSLSHISGMSATLCCLYNILRDVAGESLKVKEVHFEQNLESTKMFEDFFGCPVFYGSDCNKIVFDKEFIYSEQPFANTELACTLDEWLEEYLAKIHQDRISTQVKDFILKHQAHSELDQLKVATALSMSSRMLQRKLQEEGTVYTELLGDCRKKLSIQLIHENKMTISEVACMLGFSDQSNFTRAFKRWTGTTPHQYRV